LFELLVEVSQRSRTEARTLPPEPALANALGVSRSHLREALARLESDGLIARRSRAGTVVNAAALDIQTWLTRQEPFVETLRRLGLEDPTIELLSIRFRKMTGAESTYFEQPPGCGIVDVRKRWRAGGTVHMIADYQVPAPEARDLSEVVEPTAPVFELAARLLGASTAWEVARAHVEIPTDVLAAELEVPASTPVFSLDLMGLSRDGTRLYRTVERHVGSAVEYGFVRTFGRPEEL
jgi:GntR family transcriptional regulator